MEPMYSGADSCICEHFGGDSTIWEDFDRDFTICEYLGVDSGIWEHFGADYTICEHLGGDTTICEHLEEISQFVNIGRRFQYL